MDITKSLCSLDKVSHCSQVGTYFNGRKSNPDSHTNAPDLRNAYLQGHSCRRNSQCRRAAANLLGCSSSSPYAAIHTAVKSAAAAPARDGRARPAAIAVQTRPVAVLHTGGITVIASSPYLASRLTPIRVHIAALALHGVLAPTGGR